MRVLKKLLILVVLLISTVGFGQSKLEKFKAIPAKEMAQKKTDLMKIKLNLSKEQEVEVYKINLESFIARKKVIENSSIFSMRKKMKAIGKDDYKKTEGILTVVQLKMYNGTVKKELKDEMSNWIDKKKV